MQIQSEKNIGRIGSICIEIWADVLCNQSALYSQYTDRCDYKKAVVTSIWVTGDIYYKHEGFQWGRSLSPLILSWSPGFYGWSRGADTFPLAVCCSVYTWISLLHPRTSIQPLERSPPAPNSNTSLTCAAAVHTPASATSPLPGYTCQCACVCTSSTTPASQPISSLLAKVACQPEYGSILRSLLVAGGTDAFYWLCSLQQQQLRRAWWRKASPACL